MPKACSVNMHGLYAEVERYQTCWNQADQQLLAQHHATVFEVFTLNA